MKDKIIALLTILAFILTISLAACKEEKKETEEQKKCSDLCSKYVKCLIDKDKSGEMKNKSEPLTTMCKIECEKDIKKMEDMYQKRCEAKEETPK